jgi:hypothetical protein
MILSQRLEGAQAKLRARQWNPWRIMAREMAGKRPWI